MLYICSLIFKFIYLFDISVFYTKQLDRFLSKHFMRYNSDFSEKVIAPKSVFVVNAVT